MINTFNYYKANSISDAVDYLNNNDATIFAGGTDLMVLMRRDLLNTEHILDIKNIPELKELKYIPGDGIHIGACVTVNEVANHDVIKTKFTAISEAADSVASYQLRNRATLVGNICNASPGADLSSPLLVFDALVEIVSSGNRRVIPLKDFFLGVKKTDLKENELVSKIIVPDVENNLSTYQKQTRLKGHDLGIVGVSTRISENKDLYIAMSAVAPTPIRLYEVESLLKDKSMTKETAIWISEEVRKHISPISDTRSSAEYRKHVSGALAKKGLLKLLAKGDM